MEKIIVNVAVWDLVIVESQVVMGNMNIIIPV